MGYEILDHTGDLGIRVWAADIKGIFQETARALFDIITDLDKVEVHLDLEVAVKGSGQEELLVAWLNELLYLYEVEDLLLCDFTITEIDEGSIKGVAMGEEFDEDRHDIKTSIKAVTYHQVEIQGQDGGCKPR